LKQLWWFLFYADIQRRFGFPESVLNERLRRLIAAAESETTGRSLIFENGLASGLLQRRVLQSGVLVVCRHAGVAVFHAPILTLRYDTRQRRDWRGFQ
jgi:hypothetical protein